MIIGECNNATHQEIINKSLFDYINSYMIKLMMQINYMLDYNVYAIFFDDDTYKTFNAKQPHFPKKWFEVLPSNPDMNRHIEKAVDSAMATVLQEYQNELAEDDSCFADETDNEFRKEFFSKLAINLFRSDKKDQQWIMTSFPISSRKFKAECQGSLLDEIDDNCVVIIKFTANKEMRILRESFNEFFKLYTGLAPSFFESCVSELFVSFTDGIYKKRQHDNNEVDVDNIIELAGRNFMWTISKLLGGDLDDAEIIPNDHAAMFMIMHKHQKVLNYNIEKISALAYEKNEAIGDFVFASKDSIVKLLEFATIKFETPYELNKHKLIRKLLEIVSADYCILSTTRKIYGIIERSKITDIIDKNILDFIFIINIEKGRVWNIYYEDRQGPYSLLKSEYNNYSYIKPEADHIKFENAISKIFSSKQADPLKRIVDQASKQTHGTMIVFSKNAEDEVHRLHKCCIPVKKIDLSDNANEKIIRFITSIDGAVLCDGQGICYAIGVILDGETSGEFEDISRGARYNSAHRYHTTRKEDCVIVIISEDKDITVV